MDLTQKKCVPCEGGTLPFDRKEIEKYLKVLSTPWDVIDDKKIVHVYKFKDFKEAIAFVNRLAEIAEAEQHHPDITIIWNKVTITLTTHAIKGLSINDFIMAAKIEAIK